MLIPQKLLESKKAALVQPLSHGYAVPAPLAGEPGGIWSALASLGKEVEDSGGSLGLPAREAVSEADWRVGVPVGLFAKTGTETQPLSHGSAVPAPLAGEPGGIRSALASLGKEVEDSGVSLGLPAREAA